MSITQIIDRYIEDMQALIYEKYTARDSVSTWLGMGKTQKAPCHEQLYKDMEKEVSLVVQQLEDKPDEASAACAAREVILYGRRDFTGVEDSIRLGLLSIEALAIPLLDYMSTADISALRDEYASGCPLKDMLPRQKELYRRMCELSGEEEKRPVRKPGFLQRSGQKRRK
ncbi:MAG: hypothetical protein LUD14_06295 [Clostridiales bacterium]|nr:hypothetical protein [Clostridiales bacterium]